MKKKNILIIFTIIVVSLLYSMCLYKYINFVAINGNFQNYNPIRRFLSGQIPYKTFTDYLGLGHLYLGSIFTLLFGNNFKGSLHAFSLLSISSFLLICYVISKNVFNDNRKGLYFTLIALTIAIILNTEPFNYYIPFNTLRCTINDLFTGGNSARIIRGMIAPLSILLIMIITNYVKKKKKWSDYRELFIIAFISSLSFIWSNDFGISTWLCLLIMYIWTLISRRESWKKIIKNILLYILSSLIMIIILVEILTLGNLNNWIKSFFQTGNYQGWYYNSSKSYYWYQIDFSLNAIIQALLTIYYLIKIFIEKGTDNTLKRYGVLAFLNMTAYCAINEYKLLSGNQLFEMSYLILIITFVCEILAFIKKMFNKNKLYQLSEKIIPYGSYLLVTIVVIGIIASEISFVKQEPEGVYVEELGGYISTPSQKLKETKEFLNNEKVFSTYASAIETMTNQYQPSGYDYIIHVLGDQARTNYLDSFHNSDFKYAATIKENYTRWELWAQRANWFFYRELYDNYIPVYSNEYELFWQKGNTHKIEDNFDVIVQEDNQKIKLIIDTNNDINGIADVLISYETQSNKNPLLLQKMVNVQDNTVIYDKKNDSDYFQKYNIRDSGKEYIPITIVNGHGEAILKSLPEKVTQLKVKEVSCNTIYTLFFDYLSIINVKRDNDDLVLQLDKDNYNKIRVNNMHQFTINNQVYTIKAITTSEIIVPFDEELYNVLQKQNVIIKTG